MFEVADQNPLGKAGAITTASVAHGADNSKAAEVPANGIAPLSQWQMRISPSDDQARVASVSRLGDGGCHLRIIGVPGQLVRLLASEDLRNWMTVTDLTLGPGGAEYLDTGAGRKSRRFYRLAELPQGFKSK